MKMLLTALTTVVAVCATGGIALADEASPEDNSAAATSSLGTPGRGYALGGAHVLGIPYDEYIRRTGADWFPGLDRQIVDYPAGQVQGHTLERLFPGIGRLDDDFPGLGIDGPASASRSMRGRATSTGRFARAVPGPRSACPKGRSSSTPYRPGWPLIRPPRRPTSCPSRPTVTRSRGMPSGRAS